MPYSVDEAEARRNIRKYLANDYDGYVTGDYQKEVDMIKNVNEVIDEQSIKDIESATQEALRINAMKESAEKVVAEGAEQAVKKGTEQVVKESVEEVIEEGTKAMAKGSNGLLRMGVGAATLIGAGMLIRNISSRKGQQSNQELYGQRKAYM